MEAAIYRIDYSKISMMIVEDSPQIRDLIKAICRSLGMGNITESHDGLKAFDIFCENNPDIIIIDLMIPNLNGFQLAHRIRNCVESVNPFVSMIMLTGMADIRSVFQAREMGINEFLAKPFTADALVKKISRVIETPRRFIRSNKFFGPDRRSARVDPLYTGPERRQRSGDSQP